jgi:hypothetical protein
VEAIKAQCVIAPGNDNPTAGSCQPCRNIRGEMRATIMRYPRLVDGLLHHPRLGEGFHRLQTLR